MLKTNRAALLGVADSLASNWSSQRRYPSSRRRVHRYVPVFISTIRHDSRFSSNSTFRQRRFGQNLKTASRYSRDDYCSALLATDVQKGGSTGSAARVNFTL